jgi:hypothetical protein
VRRTVVLDFVAKPEREGQVVHHPAIQHPQVSWALPPTRWSTSGVGSGAGHVAAKAERGSSLRDYASPKFCGPACAVMLLAMLPRIGMYTGRTGHHMGDGALAVHAT